MKSKGETFDEVPSRESERVCFGVWERVSERVSERKHNHRDVSLTKGLISAFSGTLMAQIEGKREQMELGKQN